jgi:hypothetical protein
MESPGGHGGPYCVFAGSLKTATAPDEGFQSEPNTAGATVSLAACAIDVAYEPLVLPEYLQRQRLEERRGEMLGSLRDLRNR